MLGNIQIPDDIFNGHRFVKDGYNAPISIYTNSASVDKETRELYMLCRGDIFRVGMISWKEALNSLQSKNDWLNILSLGVALYNDALGLLVDMPPKKEQRQEQIRETFM